MAKTVQVKAEVEIPLLPNFLRYDGGMIPISDVSDDELKRIGAAWTEALIEKARAKRTRG